MAAFLEVSVGPSRTGFFIAFITQPTFPQERQRFTYGSQRVNLMKHTESILSLSLNSTDLEFVSLNEHVVRN